MTIDYRSVIFYFVGNIFISFLLFVFYYSTSKRRIWPISTYIIGKFLQLLSVIGIGLRGTIPDFLSIHVSLVLLMASYSFEIFSIISYDGQIRKKVLNFFIIAFCISTPVFFIFGNTHASRAIIAALAASTIFVVGSIDLLYFRKKLKFPILISSIFIIYGGIQFIRGIIILNMEQSYELYTAKPIDNIFYVAAFIYLSLSSVGFLLLLKENDEQYILNQHQVLKETSTAKNKLFRIIAHDLKSPIGALTSIAQILLEQHNELNSKQREEILTNITKSSFGTFELLKNLLEWTQSETGELTIKREKIHVGELIEKNVKLYINSLKNKQLTFEQHIEDHCFIYADRHMVNTVLRNLISNAIKFTPQDGKITLKIAKSAKNKILLQVIDTGIGIEPDKLENLFSLNIRNNMNGTNKETGTGLGLKLCKEFVEKNNGTLFVESSPNNGSVFTVKLPSV